MNKKYICPECRKTYFEMTLAKENYGITECLDCGAPLELWTPSRNQAATTFEHGAKPIK